MEHKQYEDKRIQHRLEVQSMGIERIFLRHNIPAEVRGGQVNQTTTTYRLQTQLSSGLNRLRILANDLKLAFGASTVQIEQMGEEWEVEVANPETAPVALLDLLESLPDLPPGVAALGLSEDTRPVLLNLFSEDTAHVLIMGGPQAGKTALLRTFALSLALTNKQSQIQLVLIEPTLSNIAIEQPSSSLAPLAYLPHVLSATITEQEDIIESLEFLIGEMTYRRKQSVALPRIIVFVDRLADLLEMGDKRIKDNLTQLLHTGARAGIHIVASTRRPEAHVIHDLLKTTAPVRIVGQVANETLAQSATGQADSQAEALLGQGDFLAVTGEATVRFQSAYIGDYDLHLCLDDLHRQRPPALVAQQFDPRPVLPPTPLIDHTPPAPPIIHNLIVDPPAKPTPTPEMVLEEALNAIETPLQPIEIVRKPAPQTAPQVTPPPAPTLRPAPTILEQPTTVNVQSTPKPARPKPKLTRPVLQKPPPPVHTPTIIETPLPLQVDEPTIEEDFSPFDDLDLPLTNPTTPTKKPRLKPLLQGSMVKKPKLRRVKPLTKPAPTPVKVASPIRTKEKPLAPAGTKPTTDWLPFDQPQPTPTPTNTLLPNDKPTLHEPALDKQDREDLTFDGQIIDLAPIEL